MIPMTPMTVSAGSVEAAAAIAKPWRLRWPFKNRRNRSAARSYARWLGWCKGLGVSHARQFLLISVALLELLAVLIVIVLNAGGQQADKDDVMAPETYLLKWTEGHQVDMGGGNTTEAFTLYWFLNGLCVRHGSGPLRTVTRDTGADFNFRRLDNAFFGFLAAHHACNATSELYDLDVFVNASENASQPGAAAQNGTRCRLPFHDASDPPPALSGQPAVGHVSFVFYVLDMAVTAAAWPWILWLEGSRRWQRRGRTVLAGTKGLAAVANVVAAAMLVAGTAWVVDSTSPKTGAKQDTDPQDGQSPYDVPMSMQLAQGPLAAYANSTMPVVTASSTASNLVWISAISQLFAFALMLVCNTLLAHQYRQQGQHLESGLGMRQQARSGARSGALPVYRPRGAEGDEEDLPPYQRDDPLGRPPSIEGYTHSGCTVAQGSASSPTGSGPSLAAGTRSVDGHRGPSPEYEEAIGSAGSRDTTTSITVVTASDDATADLPPVSLLPRPSSADERVRAPG